MDIMRKVINSSAVIYGTFVIGKTLLEGKDIDDLLDEVLNDED